MKSKKIIWSDGTPIYRQIIDMLTARILDGTYKEGELLPSVRQVAEEFDVSPITSAKVFQELDLENITLKRRGIGAEIREGARQEILKRAQKNFIEKEWPDLQARLKLFEIDIKNLIEKAEK